MDAGGRWTTVISARAALRSTAGVSAGYGAPLPRCDGRPHLVKKGVVPGCSQAEEVRSVSNPFTVEARAGAERKRPARSDRARSVGPPRGQRPDVGSNDGRAERAGPRVEIAEWKRPSIEVAPPGWPGGRRFPTGLGPLVKSCRARPPRGQEPPRIFRPLTTPRAVSRRGPRDRGSASPHWSRLR